MENQLALEAALMIATALVVVFMTLAIRSVQKFQLFTYHQFRLVMTP